MFLFVYISRDIVSGVEQRHCRMTRDVSSRFYSPRIMGHYITGPHCNLNKIQHSLLQQKRMKQTIGCRRRLCVGLGSMVTSVRGGTAGQRTASWTSLASLETSIGSEQGGQTGVVIVVFDAVRNHIIGENIYLVNSVSVKQFAQQRKSLQNKCQKYLEIMKMRKITCHLYLFKVIFKNHY